MTDDEHLLENQDKVENILADERKIELNTLENELERTVKIKRLRREKLSTRKY